MSRSLITKSMEIFKTEAQWNAFIELLGEKDRIITYWIGRTLESVCAQYKNIKADYHDKWTCICETSGDEPWVVWHLQQYEAHSICICLEWNDNESVFYFGVHDWRNKKSEKQKHTRWGTALNSIFKKEVTTDNWPWAEKQAFKIKNFEGVGTDRDVIAALMRFHSKEVIKFVNDKIKKVLDQTELFEQLNREQ